MYKKREPHPANEGGRKNAKTKEITSGPLAPLTIAPNPRKLAPSPIQLPIFISPNITGENETVVAHIDHGIVRPLPTTPSPFRAEHCR